MRRHPQTLVAIPVFLAATILLAVCHDSYGQEPKYDYPTAAERKPLPPGQIYSGLTWQQARAGVPNIRLISKKDEEIEYVGPKADLIDTKLWQESPSRIIFHDGKYHTWIMHLHNGKKPAGYGDWAKNYYMTSEDGYKWNIEARVPEGEEGDFDESWREGLQVVKFEGKFWMFFAGNAPDESLKQYPKRFGGGDHIGLLVADRPEGPWTRAVEEPLISRSDNPKDWDFDMCNNPYPVYFKGKWFVYYKSRNFGLARSVQTLQGVAVADKITGPYVKYENNPICDGHGSWAWVYRGGIAMLPFGNARGRIHWSPDGLHWHNVDDPLSRGVTTPLFSAFYLPHDPLCGDPVTDKEPHIIWGLDTRIVFTGKPRDHDIFRSTVQFNKGE